MPDSNLSLSVGQIALSFHVAAAAVIVELLEELGYSVRVDEAPHEQMYQHFSQGGVDLVVSAWLPASHGQYIEPFESDITRLAVIYRPYCIWGVPEYVPETEVKSVDDLARPEVAARFRKRIQGIGPGAGISRFSREMIDAYGLSARGFHFENGTLGDCISAFEDAVSSGAWAVIPLWHPQFLHCKTPMRVLDEPKGLLGGTDEATLVIRKSAEAGLSPEARNLLTNMHLGNEAVSGLDYAINISGKEPRDAARHWITENRRKVDGWLSGKAEYEETLL